MGDVTYSRKRYVFVCAGCDGLSESERRDTLTCSLTCRVKAHRSGELKRLRETANRLDLTVSRLLHVRAAMLLTPAIAQRLRAGERKPSGRAFSVYDFQGEISRAFYGLLFEYCDADTASTVKKPATKAA